MLAVAVTCYCLLMFVAVVFSAVVFEMLWMLRLFGVFSCQLKYQYDCGKKPLKTFSQYTVNPEISCHMKPSNPRPIFINPFMPVAREVC